MLARTCRAWGTVTEDYDLDLLCIFRVLRRTLCLRNDKGRPGARFMYSSDAGEDPLNKRTKNRRPGTRFMHTRGTGEDLSSLRTKYRRPGTRFMHIRDTVEDLSSLWNKNRRPRARFSMTTTNSRRPITLIYFGRVCLFVCPRNDDFIRMQLITTRVGFN